MKAAVPGSRDKFQINFSLGGASENAQNLHDENIQFLISSSNLKSFKISYELVPFLSFLHSFSSVLGTELAFHAI